MKVLRSVVVGLVTGAAVAFVAALLRPRHPGGYDLWQFQPPERNGEQLRPVDVR